MHSGIVEFFYFFPRVERALVLCCVYSRVERTLVLWNSVLYFSACGMRSGIVEFHVIYFRLWNSLWYCVILCYIFPCGVRALVLWNFMLYLSAYGMRSGNVEFCVIFFLRVERALVL